MKVDCTPVQCLNTSNHSHMRLMSHESHYSRQPQYISLETISKNLKVYPSNIKQYLPTVYTIRTAHIMLKIEISNGLDESQAWRVTSKCITACYDYQ